MLGRNLHLAESDNCKEKTLLEVRLARASSLIVQTAFIPEASQRLLDSSELFRAKFTSVHQISRSEVSDGKQDVPAVQETYFDGYEPTDANFVSCITAKLIVKFDIP